jgi:hypothetical protein
MQKTFGLCVESVDCVTYLVIRVIKVDNNKLCARMWTQFLWWVPVTAVQNALFS